ncbi:MAG: hypothetical protein WBX25_33795 [Rhodomicrobium sp.]
MRKYFEHDNESVAIEREEVTQRLGQLRAEIAKPVALPPFPTKGDFKAAAFRQVILRVDFLLEAGVVDQNTNISKQLALLDATIPANFVMPKPGVPLRPAKRGAHKRCRGRETELDYADLFRLYETVLSDNLRSDVQVCNAFVKSKNIRIKYKQSIDPKTVRRNLSDIKKLLRGATEPHKLNKIQQRFLFGSLRLLEVIYFQIPVDAQVGRVQRMDAYRKVHKLAQAQTPVKLGDLPLSVAQLSFRTGRPRRRYS